MSVDLRPCASAQGSFTTVLAARHLRRCGFFCNTRARAQLNETARQAHARADPPGNLYRNVHVAKHPLIALGKLKHLRIQMLQTRKPCGPIRARPAGYPFCFVAPSEGGDRAALECALTHNDRGGYWLLHCRWPGLIAGSLSLLEPAALLALRGPRGASFHELSFGG